MSELRRAIIASADEAQYDLQVKKLLGNKEVVAYILSKTVDEFKGMELEEVRKCVEDVYIDKVPVDPGLTNKKTTTETGDRLIVLNTEDGEQNESFIRYDIIFYVRTRNGLSKYIVNLEPQKSEPEDYHILNRGIFYDSRMISSQKERDFVGMNYNGIKCVYSIWICFGMEECCLNHIHLTDDALLGHHKWKGDLSIFNIVMIGLTNELSEKKEDYELHRMLGALLSMNMSVDERLEVLTSEYNMAVDDEMERSLISMCNLGAGVREYGIKIGIEQGMETGRAEGKEAERCVIVLNMYRQNFTPEQISKFTGINLETVQEIIVSANV